MKLPCTVWVLAAAFLIHYASCALPKGYDEELYCPDEFCLAKINATHGFSGPRAHFHRCYNTTDKRRTRPRSWGEKLRIEIKELWLKNGFHNKTCEEMGITINDTESDEWRNHPTERFRRDRERRGEDHDADRFEDRHRRRDRFDDDFARRRDRDMEEERRRARGDRDDPHRPRDPRSRRDDDRDDRDWRPRDPRSRRDRNRDDRDLRDAAGRDPGDPRADRRDPRRDRGDPRKDREFEPPLPHTDAEREWFRDRARRGRDDPRRGRDDDTDRGPHPEDWRHDRRRGGPDGDDGERRRGDRSHPADRHRRMAEERREEYMRRREEFMRRPEGEKGRDRDRGRDRGEERERDKKEKESEGEKEGNKSSEL